MRKHGIRANSILSIRKGSGIIYSRFICLWICAGLIFALPLSYGGQDSTVDMEENVITASDEGGGDLSSRDIVLIILGAIGVFFLILVIYLLIIQAGMN